MSAARSRRGWQIGALALLVAGLILMIAPTFPLDQRLHGWWDPALVRGGVYLASMALLAAAISGGFAAHRLAVRKPDWPPAVWSGLSTVLGVIALLLRGAAAPIAWLIVALIAGGSLCAYMAARAALTQRFKVDEAPARPDQRS